MGPSLSSGGQALSRDYSCPFMRHDAHEATQATTFGELGADRSPSFPGQNTAFALTPNATSDVAVLPLVPPLRLRRKQHQPSDLPQDHTDSTAHSEHNGVTRYSDTDRPRAWHSSDCSLSKGSCSLDDRIGLKPSDEETSSTPQMGATITGPLPEFDHASLVSGAEFKASKEQEQICQSIKDYFGNEAGDMHSANWSDLDRGRTPSETASQGGDGKDDEDMAENGLVPRPLFARDK